MTRGLILLVTCGASVLAQTAAEQRGKKIIDETIQAIGGEKFLTMEDRIESGRAYSFYNGQISGLSIAKIYTRYITVANNKTSQELGQREREVFGKDQDASVMFTEQGAWEITWRGAKELPKDRVDRYRDTTLRNVFYIFRQRLHEPGMTFEWRGADVLDNQPVEIVDITDGDNRTVKLYVHQSTKLPVRQVYTHYNTEQKQRDEEVTLFSRYRDAGGIQWPHQIRRERNGEKIYEIFSESVAIDKDLTDELFTLPAPGSNPAKPPKRK
jgi:hypothetical protein